MFFWAVPRKSSNSIQDQVAVYYLLLNYIQYSIMGARPSKSRMYDTTRIQYYGAYMANDIHGTVKDIVSYVKHRRKLIKQLTLQLLLETKQFNFIVVDIQRSLPTTNTHDH